MREKGGGGYLFQEGHLFDVMAKGVGAYLEEGAY